jgi:hypothetical protein
MEDLRNREETESLEGLKMGPGGSRFPALNRRVWLVRSEATWCEVGVVETWGRGRDEGEESGVGRVVSFFVDFLSGFRDLSVGWVLRDVA